LTTWACSAITKPFMKLSPVLLFGIRIVQRGDLIQIAASMQLSN
jgi:hypothetical protein